MAAPSPALQKPGESWQPEKLPPFPAVALKALKLMAGADTSLPDLCNLIRTDTAFSTEILRIANSPLVAFPRSITSVLQASMLLGFQRLRNVVLTIGLKAYLSNQFTPLLRACWRHSVASALIAERAAKWTNLDREFAHTAGIMHDIGRIALAVSMPSAYARVVDKGADRPQDLLQSERELCGLDHCEAGRKLVSAWELPEAFLAITGCHHEAGTAGRGTALLLPPSCSLADWLGFGVVKYRAPGSYADALAGFPEPARDRFPAEAKELASSIANEIKLIESA